MNGWFYTLRWKGNDFRSDEHLAASDNTVRIGQREDCDVRIPNQGQYADELFAAIKPTKSADGWQILSTSEFVRTFVNGSPVTLNHYLKSGDRISFSESSADILFEVRKGENAGTSHFTSISRRFMAIVSGAVAVAVALALYGIVAPSIVKDREATILKAAEQSVAQLSVDSIYYIRHVREAHDTIMRERLSITGTAFLTKDGILVTARHCIEPWLKYSNLDSIIMTGRPFETAWAVKAETYNHAHKNDTSFSIVSKCSLHGTNGDCWGVYRSTDFHYDNTRDDIIDFGDFSHRYYIRSITGRLNRSDMMLGDIAVLNLKPRTGTLEIPSEDLLKEKITTGTDLFFMGYPNMEQPGLYTKEDKFKQNYVPGQMIAHGGSLTPGFSGGPAFILHEGKAYVVGVISKLDKGDSSCIYSVPISEIQKIPPE